jgi:hypothetical protein
MIASVNNNIKIRVSASEELPDLQAFAKQYLQRSLGKGHEYHILRSIHHQIANRAAVIARTTVNYVSQSSEVKPNGKMACPTDELNDNELRYLIWPIAESATIGTAR